MSQTIESALSQSLPSFDQIVKGNVNIKKLSKYRYRITFSKIGKFLMYQVWDKDDVNNMNAKRQVGYVSAKEWVKSFNERNSNNFLDFKTLFTPTAIMETENSNYAFVIHKASLNSSGHVVFIVSTKEISLQNNTSKKLVQLPEGKCNHVRFDIDPMIVSPLIVINEIRKITNNREYSDPTLTDDVRTNVLKYFATLPFNRTYSLYCPTLMGVDNCGTKENYLTAGTPVYQRFVAIMKAAGFTTCLSGETFDPTCTKGCRIPGSDPVFDTGSCA
jgi:hypothetical protein